MTIPFTPSPDVARILHELLDSYERRDANQPLRRAIRVRLEELALPGYGSQIDPTPRLTANEQLRALAAKGFVVLGWQPGQDGHLLQDVTLEPQRVPELFPWLGREPLAARRAALSDLLLGDRFRFAEGDWRRLATDRILAQLRAGRSPAPFNLADPNYNQQLLAALIALDRVREEIPYRVFSVQVFNDSKVFEGVKHAVATLARRHVGRWRGLNQSEVLRELGLVANPSFIYLAGPWQLVTSQGEVVSLEGFQPAVGIPASMAEKAVKIRVDGGQVQRVVCVENLTSFFELMRYEGQGLAALCLWGNPAPPVRHLLELLAVDLSPQVPLQVWADLDYGGLSIMAGLRRWVSPRFLPYRMDVDTLEAHARRARPLTDRERNLLQRLRRRPLLADLHPLIDHLLKSNLKLEQEAVQLGSLEQLDGPGATASAPATEDAL